MAKAVFMATPFLCFAFLATLFEWLTPFNFVEGFAVLADAVWMAKAVSMADAVFMATPFLADEQKVSRASWLLDCETVSLRAPKFNLEVQV